MSFRLTDAEVIGHIQVINEVVKSGPPEQVHDLVSSYLKIIHVVNDVTPLSGNTLLRKMRTKLMSRIPIRMLPAPKVRRKGRILDGSSHFSGNERLLQEHEVPEVVETLLQHLFEALQDKVSSNAPAKFQC